MSQLNDAEELLANQTLGYLGVNYQLKLFSELFEANNKNVRTNNLFFDEVIGYLEPNYFETKDLRQLMVLIVNYYNQYKNPPNMDNIYTVINSTITNDVDRAELVARLQTIKSITLGRKNGTINNDSQVIKDNALKFIKQQEMSKIINFSKEKFAKGIVEDSVLEEISGKFKLINKIGEIKLSGKILFEDDDDIFTDEHKTIFNCGIPFLDKVFMPNGAIERTEMGVWLCPSGVGKSTSLVLSGYDGYINGKRTLHLVAEGKERDIRKKYYSKLTGIPISQLSSNKQLALDRVAKFKNRPGLGYLKIMRVPDGIKVSQIREIILKENEKLGQPIDLLVLDYLECITHSTSAIYNKWESQEKAITELENLLLELNIGCWTAVQAKKESNIPILSMDNISGTIQTQKKSTVIIGISASNNISVCKSRHLGSGAVFENVKYNKDILTVEVDDPNFIIDETVIAKEREFEKQHGDIGDLPDHPINKLDLNPKK